MATAKKKAKKTVTEDCTQEMTHLFLRDLWPVLLDLSKAGDRRDRALVTGALGAIRDRASEALTILGRE